jgi:mono/diheme cytochrome c family protein
VGRVTFGMLQCAKCHPAGPTSTAAGVSAAELAPSLLLAPGRLRHDWVPNWIKDPQSFVRGTNMPANFVKLKDGTYQSPLGQALEAPMFSAQKNEMLRYFDSEEDLKAFLSDPDKVVVALRDHIWWNLASN